MKIIRFPERNNWSEILARPVFETKSLDEKVGKVIEEVRHDGDIALRKYTEMFDQVALQNFRISESEIADMRKKYLDGGFGYGHAKQALCELIVDKYAEERKVYQYYMENPTELEKKLQVGEEKASAIAKGVLARVKKALGFA